MWRFLKPQKEKFFTKKNLEQDSQDKFGRISHLQHSNISHKRVYDILENSGFEMQELQLDVQAQSQVINLYFFNTYFSIEGKLIFGNFHAFEQ